MADDPLSNSLPSSPLTAVCSPNNGFKDVPMYKKATEMGQEMTDFMSDNDSFNQDNITPPFISSSSYTLLYAEGLHNTGIKDAPTPKMATKKDWN